jgi:cob(I)alamin adenosyltransferase
MAATTSNGRGIGIRTAAGSSERSHGQLHVYDGEGKGKSQAALGVVLRTIGLGICEQKRTRVLLLRFLKGPGRAYDEDAAIEALQQGFPHLIDQVRTGRGDFFTAGEATAFDRQEAQRGWDIAKGAIASSIPWWCSMSSTRCSTWVCWRQARWCAPWRTNRRGWK